MTVDDLIGAYIEASNAVVWEAEKRGLCPMTLDMHRIGVTAIVRALRDEIWMRTKRMDACDILLEILGPIDGEGAAKESGGRDRKYGPAWVGGGVPSPTYHISAADWWAAFMNARIVVVHGSDAGEKVAEGNFTNPSEGRHPDAAPAVCVWTRISEFDTVVHYSTPHGVMNDLNLWRGLQCSACHAPIKFTEANHG